VTRPPTVPWTPVSPVARRRQADALAVIVAAVTTVAPDLNGQQVRAALERAARTRQDTPRLAAHLRTHPDALTSGAPTGPLIVGRLIRQLQTAGVAGLVLPQCPGCGRTAELRHPRKQPHDGGMEGVEGERVCASCFNRSQVGVCAPCGRHTQLVTGIRRGQPCCASCKGSRRATCIICGRHRPVADTQAGGPRCSTCKRRDPETWEPCGGCGRRRPVNQRATDGTARCQSCYQAPTQPCAGCGRLATVAAHQDGRALCIRCYRQPTRRCGQCGRVRLVARRGHNGQPDLCPTCYPAPILDCSVCGRHARCRRTTPDRAPICFRCQLDRRLHQLLAGPDEAIPATLGRLHQAILEVDNPVTALGWLGRSPAVGVLQRLASGELALTHQALDELPRGFALDHLRQLLVASGALPDRDPHLARLERAIGQLAATLPHPDDARLLRAYGTWRVLRRLRRSAEHGKLTIHATHRGRDLAAEAARFLAWLRDHDHYLATCRQADVDQWLASGPATTRQQVRGLLGWATEQGLLTGITLPPKAPAAPPRTLQDAQRWALARRLLHDPALDPVDRVAGALVVLYAQPVARIARLTRADLARDGDQTLLRLGRDRLLLPEPLASLAHQLTSNRPVGMAGNLDHTPAWLFPGRRPGTPMHPTHLARRLGRLGVDCRASRNTALLQLAAEVPAAVLADLLGLNPSTAIKWVQLAGGNWTRYAAERARTATPPRPANGHRPRRATQ
jgi:hypothetical protein